MTIHIDLGTLVRRVKSHQTPTQERKAIAEHRHPMQSPPWTMSNPFAKATWENRSLVAVPLGFVAQSEFYARGERNALTTGKPHLTLHRCKDGLVLFEFVPHKLFVQGAGR